MKLISILVLSVLGITLSMHAETEDSLPSPELFLRVDSKSGGIKDVIRVTEDMTLKFSGDTILLSGKERNVTLDKNEVSGFSHSNSCNSEFTFSVFGDVADTPPIEGAVVALLNQSPGDFDGFIKIADNEGDAIFRNLPYGRYSVVVMDPNGDFKEKRVETVFHVVNDSCQLNLEENLFSPLSFTSELIDNEDGGRMLRLSWEMGEEPGDEGFHGYRFLLFMDENYIGDTAFTYLMTPCPEPGSHIAEVYGISLYGTQTETLSLLIDIPEEEKKEEEEAGIDLIDLHESEEWRYYDLNGRQVSDTNLSPGIYFRICNRQREKIIIR